MNMTIYEYRSRCEWLAAFYKEAAETGRAMQFHNGDWVDCDIGPNMQSYPDNWRLKPEPVTRDPSEANDQLIAAEPELLGALKMMLEGGLEGPTSQAIETALATIAKAEGRDA